MSRSPQVGVEKRRFKNVTPEIHGAVILDADNRAKGIAVDPGEEIWLSIVEEQLTAEAPVLDKDNPFIKHWECPVAWDEHGNPTGFEPRDGCLVMIEAEPRIIGSRRYTPTHGDPQGAVVPAAPDPAPEAPAAPEEPAPPPSAPPVVGEAAPDEIVGTPDAEKARDEHAAAAQATADAAKTAEEAKARARAIEEGASGKDKAGIDWNEGQPKGAPEKDGGPESRQPVATQA